MMMNTLSGSTVLPILLLSLLNGLSGHPIGERLRARQAASPPESRNMVHMQNVLHDNNCTAARQAERDNTHDIACLLETFNQQDAPFSLECNIRSFYRFPELFRALVEIVSQFEGTNLATNYNEALCTLKNIVQPSLNTTVRNFCNCATGENSVGCSSSQQSGFSSGSNSEQCLLRGLHSTLRRIQNLLGGRGVSCRRAGSDQQRALLNFNESIHIYYNKLISETPQIFNERPLPSDPCSYAGFGLNMTDHVQSLHTLVPMLSNLTSSEAQLISGNLTEVILPIVQSLVDASYGEGFYERAVNSSTPLASVFTLSEQKRTICFVNRLRATYRHHFLKELMDRDIVPHVQNNSCLQLQYSS